MMDQVEEVVSIHGRVFLFSGQGSHHFQMGRDLYDHNAVFRAWMLRLDETVRRTIGRSLIEILYSGEHTHADVFDRTLFTHPAIFMVEYALAQCLIESGVRPEMVLGTSVGFFAAAAVAGFISVEEGLTAVMQQAIAIEEHGEPGGMIAVLADPAMFNGDFLGRRSELAAVNFSTHFVLSAPGGAVDEITDFLSSREIGFYRLPVSFPFHSRWIDRAWPAFELCSRSIRRKQGRIPLVCCDRATILTELSEKCFWNVVRHPIRFRETIARLEEARAFQYIDVGPSGTLATFLRYGASSMPQSAHHAILTRYGVDQRNLARLLSAIKH